MGEPGQDVPNEDVGTVVMPEESDCKCSYAVASLRRRLTPTRGEVGELWLAASTVTGRFAGMPGG